MVERIQSAIAHPPHAAERLAERIEGVTAAGISVQLGDKEQERPWDALLDSLAERMPEDPDEIFVIALDEAPWWLDALERERQGAARTALAQLRHLRGRFPRVRWVLTGSIALARPAIAWGATAELNDLDLIEVPPMTEAEGRTVFEMVCLDAQREVSAEAAGLAHQLAGGLPHWIRVLAERSRSAGEGEGLVSVEIVAAECERLLSRANRHLFEEEGRTHFERRYAPEERLVARDVLVRVAKAEPALRQGVVAALLCEGADKPRIERVLDRLLDEFYLDESEGSLRFVVPLMMRWFVRWA
jgi:hypothetical protein